MNLTDTIAALRSYGLRGRDFESKITQQGDCFLWHGAFARRGYGLVTLEGRLVILHRLAYRAVKGEIPEGLVIDHLCRVTNCFNPDHLEAVTNRENILRGVGVTAQNSKKLTCPQGHEYDYLTPEGKRACKTCRSENRRRYRQRLREQGLPSK